MRGVGQREGGELRERLSLSRGRYSRRGAAPANPPRGPGQLGPRWGFRRDAGTGPRPCARSLSHGQHSTRRRPRLQEALRWTQSKGKSTTNAWTGNPQGHRRLRLLTFPPHQPEPLEQVTTCRHFLPF
ncbi:uncharacterized protein KIAA0040 homolog isoform X1 [Sus scrofa]|uniref:uncharacterized protein KIAA0040 homolog isoform X1 n=1 Tax=Sus scrofa TaxID=9823 RepID=UPI000A2B2503|nr:uncharacterized protein KIAA0040 homolog isoform X1 [Sus scrofa]